MVILNRPVFQSQPERSKGPPLIHYGGLQSKFTLFLTAFLGGSFSVFGGIVWYLTSKNYDLLKEIALTSAPEIVPHLERELNILGLVLLAGTVALSATTYALVHRRLSKIQGPLYALENQLRSLVSGDWSLKDIRIRREDEFQSLVGASNLFYQTLKNETRTEIEFLENLILHSKINPESNKMAVALLQSKKSKIKMDHSPIASVTVVNFEPSVENRRVS